VTNGRARIQQQRLARKKLLQTEERCQKTRENFDYLWSLLDGASYQAISFLYLLVSKK
jgi:hypothetical protein